MYAGCTSLEVAPHVNTTEVIDALGVFENCTSIKYVPLLNLPVVVNVNGIFYNCVNVEGGALDLYNRLLPRASEIGHSSAFYNCGINTPKGSEELSKIPADWKSYL